MCALLYHFSSHLLQRRLFSRKCEPWLGGTRPWTMATCPTLRSPTCSWPWPWTPTGSSSVSLSSIILLPGRLMGRGVNTPTTSSSLPRDWDGQDSVWCMACTSSPHRWSHHSSFSLCLFVQGPFPTKWTTGSSGEEAAVTVDYQKPFNYSPMENSGFFYCCSSGNIKLNSLNAQICQSILRITAF